VEEREISLLFRQHGEKVAERGEDGRADSPAVAVLDGEQRSLPQDRRSKVQPLARSKRALPMAGQDAVVSRSAGSLLVENECAESNRQSMLYVRHQGREA
jgi:hypothetical protein